MVKTPFKSELVLTLSIAGALVLALLSVVLFGEKLACVEWLGTLFITALKMLVMPLIFSSVVMGVAALGDVRKLGRFGGLTVGYYALTTAIAVGLGIVLVNIFQPGAGVSFAEAKTVAMVQDKQGIGIPDLIMSFVSPNIFQAFAEMDILPVIVFSLVFGGILTTLGEQGKAVLAVVEGVEAAIMKMVHGLMWFAPIGIFGLVAGRFARAGDLGILLERLGMYMGVVVLGLAIHAFIILPLIFAWARKQNPFVYMGHMASALMTAFSTASSSATLPISLQCVEEGAGIEKRSARFVLPLGATINMDGTALYEAVAALFIAQAAGIALGPFEQCLIFVTATLAAVGAAGIPQAGLVTMVLVLKTVGLPMEGIGLILAVDWLLDRFRTTVNVWGDTVGAAVIEKVAKT